MSKIRGSRNRKPYVGRWMLLLCILVVAALLAKVGLRLYDYYQYAEERPISWSFNKHSDDTLRVAFIGDSWAAYHASSDTLLQSLLSGDRRPASVTSLGNVGAKSKEIYQRFFTTSLPLLMQQPDYCVLSAGINDAVAKMGSGYYVHHYLLMIRLLLQAGIKPVVLEMPEVNYRAIAEREGWLMRIHHRISALMTGSEMYSFDAYRRDLWHALVENGLQDSVSFVKADAWNPDGYRDGRCLYRADETHLNALGYQKLDSCIASILKAKKVKKK